MAFVFNAFRISNTLQLECPLLPQDFAGKTALHHALVSHRTKSVIILLDAGADPTHFNHNLLAPIHDAAGYGFLP